MLKMRANNRYLNWAETCYKISNLLFAPNVLLFRKIGGTPFAKSKIQRMSPNFVHCMYLIFEPILLRRKFWGIPLRRNDKLTAYITSMSKQPITFLNAGQGKNTPNLINWYHWKFDSLLFHMQQNECLSLIVHSSYQQEWSWTITAV